MPYIVSDNHIYAKLILLKKRIVNIAYETQSFFHSYNINPCIFISFIIQTPSKTNCIQYVHKKPVQKGCVVEMIDCVHW